MSLLDELEISDSIQSAEEVAKITSESLIDTTWYDYVNRTSTYTHILVICLDEKYFIEDKTDILGILSRINCIADAHFVSHSDLNIVVVEDPERFMITNPVKLEQFVHEPSFKNGGPMLKSQYRNGCLRIKLAVEFPKHYAMTKYLNFLVSVRSFLDSTQMVPRDGEFIEVYCREQNNVWRTLLPEAMEYRGLHMEMHPMFGEGNLAYFYKFVENKKEMIESERTFGTSKITNCPTELPQESQDEVWKNTLKHWLAGKMIESSPAVSRQVEAWVKRADRFYKKCRHHTNVDIEDMKPQPMMTYNGQKFTLKPQLFKEKANILNMRAMLIWTSIAASAAFIVIMTIYHLLLR